MFATDQAKKPVLRFSSMKSRLPVGSGEMPPMGIDAGYPKHQDKL
jgi:hypothetical protein